MLALVAILWGVIVALACGGDLRHLGRLRLAGEAFIVPCFVFQAVVRGRGFGLTGIPSVSISLWAAASLVLCICLLLNWRRPGCYFGQGRTTSPSRRVERNRSSILLTLQGRL